MASSAKKSLFSKPAFSKSATAKVQPSASAIDLFSRADSSYSAILEEEAKRIEKRKIKAAQRAGESSRQNDLTDGTRKRQCVSISDTSSVDGSDDDQPKRNKVRSPTDSPPPVKHIAQVVPSGLSSTKPFINSSQEVVELSDDDDDQKVTHTIRRQSGAKVPEIAFVSSTDRNHRSPKTYTVDLEAEDDEEEDEVEPDDEFAELARQARETARKKQESQAEKAVLSFQTNSVSASQHDHHYEAPKAHAINIHVESPIPGVERKTLKRRLDQGLRQVRLIWCDANGFSDEESKRIILMFRGQRVYDVNTPESLGISVDDQGETHVRGDDPLNPLEPSGDIVMEAITEDHEKTYISDWLKKHGRGPVENDEEKMVESKPRPQEPAQESVKIICRAKNFPDFKVAVKKSTTIARIQQVFAIQNQLAGDIEVFVMFDGERPEPEATIGDLEIESMDVVDIQVKYPQ